MGEVNDNYEEDLKAMIKASAGAELCATVDNVNHVKASSCVSAYDQTWKGTIDLTDSVTVGELERVGDDIKYHWRVPYNVMDSSGNHAETVWRDVIVEELSLEQFERAIREEERQKATDAAVAKAQALLVGTPSRGKENNSAGTSSRTGRAQQHQKGKEVLKDGRLGSCPKCPECPKCICPNSEAECKSHCESLPAVESGSNECPTSYIGYDIISVPTRNELLELSRYILFIIIVVALLSIILLTYSWVLNYSSRNNMHNVAGESSIDVQYFHSPSQPSETSNQHVPWNSDRKTPPRFQMTSPSLNPGSVAARASPHTSSIYSH